MKVNLFFLLKGICSFNSSSKQNNSKKNHFLLRFGLVAVTFISNLRKCVWLTM